MSLFSIGKRVALATSLVIVQAVNAASTDALTLQAAVEQALQDNPGLAQIKARAEAMAAIPSQTGTLPDPIISFNALNLPVNSFSLAQENMTQMQGGISQAIPFPGKLALAEQAATFDAAAAAHDVIEARWRLLRDVKKIWWSLFYLDRALEIIRGNQDLLHQFVDIAQTKYQVGEGLQQDVLLAQLELSKLLDNQLKLTGTRAQAEAQLNALLNRSADVEIRIPEQVSEALPTLATQTVLFRQAENYRALLAARREAVNAAQSRLDLAHKNYYPDFNFGAYYGGRSGMYSGQQRADFLTLRLSMSLPLYFERKQSKAVDQRSRELLARKYELQDEWNKVRAEISAAYAEFRQTKKQAVLFKTGIIPQAKQTVASMLAGYQVDKVDFLNLVRSQITLYNYEYQYWRALSQANQTLARLAAVVGREEIYE